MHQLEQKTPWHIIPASSVTIKRIHSSTVQSEIGTVFLATLSTHYSLSYSGITS